MSRLILPTQNGVYKHKRRPIKRKRKKESQPHVVCVGDECRKLLKKLCCLTGECVCTKN